ncbi:MAG TPA: HAD family hydrolase [Candidatus Limnocylindria bacterium]|jgi:HAD superfamily hydrolase (TIGR01509 family)|nr:HAD family hydrolase [Candidatus Limnocylindria bacterium]
MTTCIFFDAAGVLLDARVMPTQWQRLVSEFLAPRLGGDPESWKAANAWAAERMFARYRDPRGTPRETNPRLLRLWLREMCERVGVPVPKDAGALAVETTRWVTERVIAPMPGVVDALRSLKARGFRLFTSSANTAPDIRGYLKAIGILELFDDTYGVDLIDRWKTNAGFYRKVLEQSGVRAEDAATVDDQERCLDWAKRAGFRTFLLAPAGTGSSHEVIASLSELAHRL